MAILTTSTLPLKLALSENMIRTVLSIILSFLLLFTSNVSAHSCKDLEDTFISECTKQGCGEILYVKEIKGYASCARKPSFAIKPGWAREVFEYEVAQANFDGEKSLFLLSLRKRHWKGNFGFESFDEYFELRAKRDKSLGSFGSLKILTDTTFKDEGAKWSESIKRQNRIHQLRYIFTWFWFALCLIALIFSVLWFNSWLGRRKSWHWLVAGFMIHLLFIYFLLSASISTVYILAGSVGFLLPGVWLYQVTRVVLRWYRERGT